LKLEYLTTLIFNEIISYTHFNTEGEGIAMEETLIGYVSDYFRKISVAAVEITSGIVSLGDTIRFKGYTTDFKSRVDSMQIEHESVTEAKQGDSIGVKVSERVRKGDKVYKVTEE
jgi:translation elongation factor EF-1alpha